MSHPQQFLDLMQALNKEAPALQFAPPVVVNHNGRTYALLAQTGEVHGLATLCAWDDNNAEFLVWDGGSPYLDWESTALEEAEYHDGVYCEKVQDVIHLLQNPGD